MRYLKEIIVAAFVAAVWWELKTVIDVHEEAEEKEAAVRIVETPAIRSSCDEDECRSARAPPRGSREAWIMGGVWAPITNITAHQPHLTTVVTSGGGNTKLAHLLRQVGYHVIAPTVPVVNPVISFLTYIATHPVIKPTVFLDTSFTSTRDPTWVISQIGIAVECATHRDAFSPVFHIEGLSDDRGRYKQFLKKIGEGVGPDSELRLFQGNSFVLGAHGKDVSDIFVKVLRLYDQGKVTDGEVGSFVVPMMGSVAGGTRLCRLEQPMGFFTEGYTDRPLVVLGEANATLEKIVAGAKLDCYVPNERLLGKNGGDSGFVAFLTDASKPPHEIYVFTTTSFDASTVHALPNITHFTPLTATCPTPPHPTIAHAIIQEHLHTLWNTHIARPRVPSPVPFSPYSPGFAVPRSLVDDTPTEVFEALHRLTYIEGVLSGVHAYWWHAVFGEPPDACAGGTNRSLAL